MNRTGGERPQAVRKRDDEDAGSGTHARPGRSTPGGSLERGPLPTRFSDLPPLPPSFGATLESGIATFGLELGASSLAALEAHARLLLAWTSAINLTAIRDPEAVAREHLLDSLAAVPLLRARGIEAILDLGSGGGFPGLPLAIALPTRRALLVDSIAKKTRFLATVADALADAGLPPATPVEVATARAEELAADRRHRERWPAVVVRAVAALPELAELAFPLLRPGGLLLAWKRLPIAAELDAARAILPSLGRGRIDVVPVRLDGLDDHVLVAIEKVGATPPRYPRSPAERRRALEREAGPAR